MDCAFPAAGGAGKRFDGPCSPAVGTGDGWRLDSDFAAPPANTAGGKRRHDGKGVSAPATAKGASQFLKYRRVLTQVLSVHLKPSINIFFRNYPALQSG